MLNAIRWMFSLRTAPGPAAVLPQPPQFTACTWCGLHHDPFAHCRPARTVERDLMTNTRARELVHDAARRVEEIADGLGDTNVGEALYALSGACRLLAEVTEKQDRGGHD
jgi:hypothetical protein